jgi:hypothetical protein
MSLELSVQGGIATKQFEFGIAVKLMNDVASIGERVILK